MNDISGKQGILVQDDSGNYNQILEDGATGQWVRFLFDSDGMQLQVLTGEEEARRMLMEWLEERRSHVICDFDDLLEYFGISN